MKEIRTRISLIRLVCASRSFPGGDELAITLLREDHDFNEAQFLETGHYTLSSFARVYEKFDIPLFYLDKLVEQMCNEQARGLVRELAERLLPLDLSKVYINNYEDRIHRLMK